MAVGNHLGHLQEMLEGFKPSEPSICSRTIDLGNFPEGCVQSKSTPCRAQEGG